MVTFRSLIISIFPLILLLTRIDALRHRSARQKRADVCPNPNRNTCLFITCENGGQCFEDLTTLDCFKCQCTSGYTGKLCDTPIAILPTGCNPGCQNGGVCNVNVCVCLTGYTGTLCEIRNFCLPINPCQNGGRCTSTGASYVCDCTSTGYTGTICTDPILIDPCASNPCQNNGQCSWNGAIMNCLCFNGYTGAYCQIPPVPCAATPCENGGKCDLLATNTYGCVCPEEFTGTRCETPIMAIHPCVTMPSIVCRNGGVCTTNGANYLCKCAVGWTGTNCEIKETTSSCNPSPCGVHGSCVEAILPSGTIAYCNCDNQWTGKYCDVNMNDVNCPVGYCLSGGVCRMNGNVPYCDCPPFYTGQRCETFVSPLITTTSISITTPVPITTTISSGGKVCYSNPCRNSGICYENSDAYRCECVEPWSGPTCETFLVTVTTTGPTISPDNVCSPNPCSNGGICYPSADSFMCSCMSPFIGPLCQTILTTTPSLFTTPGVANTCADQPCKNGGSCVPMGTSYSCFCGLTTIYNGKNCDSTAPMPINECPLDCAPGRCIFSGNPSKPYACLWNGIMRPIDGTTG